MIEFTFTEFVLFAWAGLATGMAFKFHHEMTMAKFFVRKLITDETVRNDLVAAYQKLAKEHGA
jgi:hypothetical protein